MPHLVISFPGPHRSHRTPKPTWGATPITQESGASLHEIQEAETKMAEARKAAEQKEKAAHALTPAGDDVPKATSWDFPHVMAEEFPNSEESILQRRYCPICRISK